MKVRYVKVKLHQQEDGKKIDYELSPDNVYKDISAAEADTILSTLGLTFIKATTLEQFIQRSNGNTLTVQQEGWEHAFFCAE